MEITMEKLERTLSLAKWGWGLLVGTFVLGGFMNYQLMMIRFDSEQKNTRITNLEDKCDDYWTTLNMKHLYANIEFWTNHIDAGTSFRNAIIDEVKRK